MKITILTVGSRGDVEPYVALGLGLKKAGHEVTVATHENFRDFVQAFGLHFFPTAGDPFEMLKSEEGQKWLASGKNPLTFISRMNDVARSFIWQGMDDYLKACQDAEAVLFTPLAALPAVSIAEKLHLVYIPAYLQHVHPTRVYPVVFGKPLPIGGGLLNRWSYHLFSQIYWQFQRSMINQWRKERLQLEPYPFRGPFKSWWRQKKLCLYGFSAHVLPRAPEWGEDVQITGYWFLEKSSGWQAPKELVDFLGAGPPPVLIGFGSMVDRDPEELEEISVKALAQSRQRGIIVSGWGGIGRGDLPGHIFRIDYAPYEWLFPRTAAVVHHGGAGATAAGLRAGIPSILVPFFADQPFWAWRVGELGVGPEGIPRRKLTVARLAAAITEAVTDKGMQNRAAALGRLIRAEDGVSRASSIISDHLKKTS